TMPEEINRMATDAIVDDLFVTEESGLKHLAHEGVASERVHFVGNTMIDSLHYALPRAKTSSMLADLGLQAGGYVLVTMHRPSNVDDPLQLRMLIDVLSVISHDQPLVFPVHPRTRKNLQSMGIDVPAGLLMIDPLGYVDFLALMRSSAYVLTDSGGIQEETTALRVPCITSRTTTERPVTVELGTNILVEPTSAGILGAVAGIRAGNNRVGQVPPLWDGHAAERIAEVITAHYS
ncbi:MAG: UDP-N-acetylglucosamine 2-epimerase, partial [Candidatus Kapabacteria bacterium]|nr:UDP-N-acetylglucosamine 2-epimerase [Candidatus Kapabacteria bacterium]